MVWFWAILAGVALGVEMLTATFYFALVAVGALAGVGAAAVGAPPLIQGIVMGAVTLLGIVFVRPFARKHFSRVPALSRTGVDALTGSEALALTGIDGSGGQIKLKGEVWSARTDPDISTEPISPNSRVSVSRIDGATALVFPLD